MLIEWLNHSNNKQERFRENSGTESALIFAMFFEELGGLRPPNSSKNKQERYIKLVIFCTAVPLVWTI
jgi:hypothetical protein